MLRDVDEAMRKHYYDPKFHGLDLAARFKAAQEEIEKATSLSQAFWAIAAALDPLNDSHTHFLPPSRPFRISFGYRMMMVGDGCFVAEVRPGTDAAAKLKPGGQILTFEGYSPTRDTLWRMEYFLNGLAPRAVHRLQVRAPDGAERAVSVQARVRQEKHVVNLTGGDGGSDIWQLIRQEETAEHLLRQRYIEMGDVFLWKMPEFDMNDEGVDHMWGRARKFKTVILDLRGNPGGLVSTLGRMVGNVFDHDVKIADRIGRKELKPQIGKTRGGNAYTGKIIVLVDSRSASAAELFARTMQLEHRGTVLGDASSGSVMESRYYPLEQGMDTKIFYGASITDADLIMADGKSLEHNGVVPDERVLPTAADLAAGRDPVLARAAALAELTLDPVAAGKLFPFEWSPNE